MYRLVNLTICLPAFCKDTASQPTDVRVVQAAPLQCATVLLCLVAHTQSHTMASPWIRCERKVYAGRPGLWEALDRPLASQPLEGVWFLVGRGEKWVLL